MLLRPPFLFIASLVISFAAQAQQTTYGLVNVGPAAAPAQSALASRNAAVTARDQSIQYAEAFAAFCPVSPISCARSVAAAQQAKALDRVIISSAEAYKSLAVEVGAPAAMPSIPPITGRINSLIGKLDATGAMTLIGEKDSEVTFLDGRKLKYADTASETAMRSGGFTAGELVAAREESKTILGTEGTSGSATGESLATAKLTAAGVMPVASVREVAAVREKPSLQGLYVDYNGDRIGIKQGDVFSTISNRYQAESAAGGFLP